MKINKKPTTPQTKKAPQKKTAPQKTKPQDNKAVTSLIAELNKKYGENTIGFSGDIKIEKVSFIPTGSLALDIALGGGVAIGRYTQLEGAFSATKTTQALHIIKSAQKIGLKCAMADGEGTTDPAYLTKLGIDVDSLIYFRPDGLEECCNIIIDLQRSGEVQLALIDSLAVLQPVKVLESGHDETVQMGIKQKVLDEFYGKYQMSNNRLAKLRKTPFTLIATNQLREKIGFNMGDPEYSPGGRAKDFASSANIRLRKGQPIKEGKGDNAQVVGHTVTFRVSKNKVFKAYQSGEFDFYQTENNAGVEPSFNDNFKSIVIEAVAWEVIRKSGAWFYIDDDKFQGTDALIAHLRKSPEMVDKLTKEVLSLVRNEDQA